VSSICRERAFRDKLINLAAINVGETILDVGCGTGILTIAAKLRVGASGTVYGVDASPEMIARARRKVKKAGLEIEFKVEAVEALRFPDAHFDALLSTLMLHHLPQTAREQCAREIRRVLKPGARVLAVDFGSAQKRKGLIARLHRHGHMKLPDLLTLLSETGFNLVESGAVGFRDLQFVLAIRP
jgi:ubiquinone/menaquinone biosynthesis C-methylase UbiE